MTTLSRLLPTKLQKIKRLIEDFFTKAHFNVLAYKLFRSEEYQMLNGKFEQALTRQLLHWADLGLVNQAFEKVKILVRGDEMGLLTFVQNNWLPILGLIDQKELQQYYSLLVTTGGQQALKRMGIEAEFKLQNMALKVVTKERVNFLLKSIDETTQKYVVQFLQTNLGQGVDPKDVVRLLQGQALSIAKERTNKIMETETVWGASLGEYRTYAKNGVLSKKWITAHNEKVCPICMDNEAEDWVDINQEFSSGHLHPSAHPVCQCFLEIKISQIPEKPWTGA